jgi:hypothetical protein
MIFLAPVRSIAQAAQAAAGVSEPHINATPEAIRAYRDDAVAFGASLRAQDKTRLATESAKRFEELEQLSRVIERTSTSDRRLPLLLFRFQILVQQLDESIERQSDEPGRTAMKAARTGGGGVAITFPFTLSTRTVFSIGISQTLQGKASPSIDVATNLLGTTLGAAVGAVGGGDVLKAYIENNFAFGLSLPPKASSALSNGYSIGLGSVTIKKRTFWPVLAFQQLDTMATRAPASVTMTEPTRATWTAPAIGIGFTWISKDEITSRLNNGKLVPILSVAIYLPYYFPGAPTAGFGALFSGGTDKFVGAGKPALNIGLSLPLMRTDGVTH